ncbi:MAG: hypothetical protein OFPII_35760 [Osedax symbiont Rs1]|nr:MAG: hypothetical protein OFPII_35760 [Osedax symbiont Rs1]
MIKPKRPSKSEIRQSLNDQMDKFLQQGGEIQQYDQGDSSLVDGRYDRNQFVYGLPKQVRTPVADTLSAINQRKSSKSSVILTTRRLRKVKKVIYDDFGEPLREIWVEE